MSFELTILGSSSATPTPDRFPSAQFLVAGEHYMLIDCGEGAQIQMMRYGLKSFRLDKIFISHLHPDHFLGLPGLISSLSLKGRTLPLDIFCPKGLQEILEVQFLFGEVHLSYELIFHIHPNEGKQIIFEDKNLKIYSFPVNHRAPCWGFLFMEKKYPRKMNKLLPEASKLPPEAYQVLRSGKDFKDSKGNILHFEEYTIPSEPPSSYCYITDTLYEPDIAASLKEYHIDLLYHEATFLDELKDKALATYHSTAREAADFAKISEVKKLIIGHFSSRYKDLEPLLSEAREVFPETYLAIEGERFLWPS